MPTPMLPALLAALALFPLQAQTAAAPAPKAQATDPQAKEAAPEPNPAEARLRALKKELAKFALDTGVKVAPPKRKSAPIPAEQASLLLMNADLVSTAYRYVGRLEHLRDLLKIHDALQPLGRRRVTPLIHGFLRTQTEIQSLDLDMVREIGAECRDPAFRHPELEAASARLAELITEFGKICGELELK